MPAVFKPELEAALVRDFFRDQPLGFFVEVGANDPRRDSQSFHLEEAGWTGILIEPLPDLAAELRRQRKAQVFEVACSSPDRAGQIMQLHVAGAFSSFDPDLAVTGMRADRIIDVKVRTLDDVLSQGNASAPIDLMSVDVEGHELEVLSGFDFSRWKPRLVLLEDHVSNLNKHRFMSNVGYALMRRTGLNGWYVPRGEAPPMDLLGRWQIFRKYYLALPFRMVRDARRRLRDRIRFRHQDASR
ncbi:MAG: FkbM family methyltransferase [Pseudorhodoplanes sp.]|uniref:FkbM family methyltransferase n=1 Tax=Pseudorhodoplanes sp. TaxID=1934341 RepID=UPI003D0CCC7D